MEGEVRLLPLETADGPHNMAADEVLLESAMRGVASLRFYQWREATLSLGYFQPAASRLADPLLANLPFVRRPSGGQNLVHHLEVTYALALPAGPPWQTGESWLVRTHRIIVDGFRTLGVELTPAEAEQRDPATSLCFRQFTPGDLLCRGSKVVGSAQRRHRQCLLQHGGILLARSPHAPTLPGVRELSRRVVSAEQTRAVVIEAFACRTAWHLFERDWDESERVRMDELIAGKYSNAQWNLKR